MKNSIKWISNISSLPGRWGAAVYIRQSETGTREDVVGDYAQQLFVFGKTTGNWRIVHDTGTSRLFGKASLYRLIAVF